MKNALIVAAFVAVAVIGFTWERFFPNPLAHPQTPALVQDLPGLQTGPAPWKPELSRLIDRLHLTGLPALQEEGSIYHAHQHLDIYVRGKAVTIPAGIGINESAGFISPLHTHEPDGIIHIESDRIRNFTLGEFFDVWGVRFDAMCIGSYCAEKEKPILVYVNGKPFSGDPRALILAPQQEIFITYGASEETPPVPKSYTFPPGI